MPLIDVSQISTETVLQLVGSIQTVGSETPTVDRVDASGNVVEAHGTVVPTASTPGYAKSAQFRKTDAGAGVNGDYVNVGTSLLCNFVVRDTAVGGAATALVDTNGVTALDVGTATSAVNNLRVTDAATGNAPSLSAVGSDTNIGLTVAPKGTGGLTLGTTTAKVSVKGSSITQSIASNIIAPETGANNAIAGALLDDNGVAVPLTSGLMVNIILSHSLQAGANTFNYNAGGAVAIKSRYNPATDIGTAYVSGGVLTVTYNGSVWVDNSQ